MSRQASNQAKQTYGESNALEQQSSANANSLYNQLEPTFQNEATNPQGFNPKEMADMTTASQQSAGGALGAATGKGAQYAAANRNAGSFAPVLDEASRSASRNLGNKTLDIQNQNALMKENQRQSGIAGLEGLDTQQNNDTLASLGLDVNSTNALTAASPGWVQNLTGVLGAIRGAGASGGSGDDAWAFTA